jgi:hypothetical protein
MLATTTRRATLMSTTATNYSVNKAARFSRHIFHLFLHINGFISYDDSTSTHLHCIF